MLTESREGTRFEVVRRTPDEFATNIPREATATKVGADNQEAAMWERFARLIGAGAYGKEEDSLLDSWDFWPRIAVVTQAVMDACMESAYSRNGAAVEIVVPQ